MDTFIHLLTVQMSNQNPLDPTSDSEYFAQISQLGQVQGLQALQKQGDLTQAQSLIGKQIGAVDTSSASGDQIIAGTVTGVTVSNGTYKLTVKKLDGTETSVSMDSVQQVYSSDAAGQSYIPADYSYLIGKHIAGLNGTTPMEGDVTSITTSNGTIMAEITTSSGTKLQLPVGGIQTIS
ncbi:MAG: hypothetical protein JST51_03925 [Armatimonadetes bacterium]|nr:hypothetical protein [Armatimonadota bacterium]